MSGIKRVSEEKSCTSKARQLGITKSCQKHQWCQLP